jgi:hypothetical protein
VKTAETIHCLCCFYFCRANDLYQTVDLLLSNRAIEQSHRCISIVRKVVRLYDVS